MAFELTTSPGVPALEPGDNLTRDEFERRHAAMPDLKNADFIEGVVHMARAARYQQHARPERALSAWLSFYEEATRGVETAGNCPVRLDLDNVPQPDILLRLPEQAGGGSRVAGDGYLEGPPELVVEVAVSTVSCELHQKQHVYRRSGVLEYLVHRVDDGEVDWFVLTSGVFVRLQPDADGLLKSRSFPGLWLDVGALLAADLRALRAAVERGCASAEHGRFVQRLSSP